MSHEQEAWTNVLLPSNSNIHDAILSLDRSGPQIVLVVSSDSRLCGTITDGDVRRALLRGLSLQSRVDEIMFRSPMVAPPEFGRDMVLQLMRANKIHQLPVVDADRRVIGLHVWDEIISPVNRDNVVIIMAGGLGKRLRPYTEDCPKPMLPVAGKPMLEHIIDRARAGGFSRFVLSVYYLRHLVEEYFGNGERWQVDIQYLREDSPLGTAGAISLLSPHPELPFLVTNGDVLTDINYAEMLDFHCNNGAVATMAVRQYEWQHPFGVVHTDGINIVGFEEKPIHRTHVNAGIYVLDPEVLAALAKGVPCDMPALFELLQKQGKSTVAYAMHEPWLDVGRPEDLKHARLSLKNND
jgi:dTDP-glucose pyrophosphorylase/predicted transcriptional regulator